MKIDGFELSQEAREYRDKLAARLLELPEVQTFMKTYQCPQVVVVENASQFKRWVEGIRASHKITRSMIDSGESTGMYLDLQYDPDYNVLKEVMRESKALIDYNQEHQYLNRYRVMPLSQALKDAQFDNVDIKIESPNYRMIYAKLLQFVREDESELGYYLCGDLGVGKTYLAACVTNYYAKKGHNVALIHVPSFLNKLKASFGSDETQDYIDALKRVKVLVLDDLGAEPITPWSRDEVLLSILNDRMENKRKTIITSNYLPEHLIEKYQYDSRGGLDPLSARRLVDRILMLTKPLELKGKNRRFTHKQ